ncbi:cytochrome b/b6 domain-containing protein [Antarctobacter heliothermus]|uniref:Cytochrome b561 n=1 Tax=Antarctobacter heliothermus TaxID=74033 RepID=A0A239GPR0_9RHOB|nr:cytochrome b/b6 domain-containing protein [Antarctobacter heliothermus]SNS71206.1 Cytochrome b561 [Antarctobacter heliothermus]
MALTNTSQSYGAITKTLHWLTAFGILGMIPLGLIANELPYDTAEQLANKAWLFSLHKTVGVALFFIALSRILWALTQTKPTPLHPERRAETFAAETVHWLLYGSLVAVPLSGWVHHAATAGFAPIWWPFGQSLPLVPESETLSGIASGLHWVFVWVLVLSLGLHIAGAVKHHVIDRDATLRRMLPCRTQASGPKTRSHGLGAAATALAAWAVALVLGGFVGAYGHGGETAEVATLQKVESDWQVTEGTLALGVRQFGQEVEGSFGEWTAEITYDESDGLGPKGDVTVEVAIGSLTLGSVTAQAMGPDFFDATQFPTAIFTAQILRGDNGLVANGTLDLKGRQVPITLPFALTIDGNVAQMTGSTTLDRRDFGIGDNMTDPAQLDHMVRIDVTLTAERAE